MRNPDLKPTVTDTLLAPLYESDDYVETYLKPHLRRFETTAAWLQTFIKPGMRLIDIGSYGSLVPVLRDNFQITDVTITLPPSAKQGVRTKSYLPNARRGADYPVHIDRFDIEQVFPYSDDSFDVVLFTEVLEHLAFDPVHTLSEINRILKQGGWLLVSTPNCASAKSLLRILIGRNPNFYTAYNKNRTLDRHNREYTAAEVRELLRATGFDIQRLETDDVYGEGPPPALRILNGLLRLAWLLSFGRIRKGDRGDTIFTIARKSATVRERHPAFLYA